MVRWSICRCRRIWLPSAVVWSWSRRWVSCCRLNQTGRSYSSSIGIWSLSAGSLTCWVRSLRRRRWPLISCNHWRWRRSSLNSSWMAGSMSSSSLNSSPLIPRPPACGRWRRSWWGSLLRSMQVVQPTFPWPIRIWSHPHNSIVRRRWSSCARYLRMQRRKRWGRT